MATRRGECAVVQAREMTACPAIVSQDARFPRPGTCRPSANREVGAMSNRRGRPQAIEDVVARAGGALWDPRSKPLRSQYLGRAVVCMGLAGNAGEEM